MAAGFCFERPAAHQHRSSLSGRSSPTPALRAIDRRDRGECCGMNRAFILEWHSIFDRDTMSHQNGL
jgi:hypothetical protein